MPTIDEVADFVREETGYGRAIVGVTTLQDDIGVYGDDMHKFMAA